MWAPTKFIDGAQYARADAPRKGTRTGRKPTDTGYSRIEA